MSERTPVGVEARFGLDGSVTPLAIVEDNRRRAIAAVGRQWDEDQRRCFDVQMDSGETVILYLECRSLGRSPTSAWASARWYVVGTWGRSKMA